MSLSVSTSRLSNWTTTRSGHRRPLERRDVDERRRGHEHPARVDAQVAREAIDAGAELEPALPVGQADRAAAAGLRAAARARRGRPTSGRPPAAARRRPGPAPPRPSVWVGGAGGSQRSGRPSRSVRAARRLQHARLRVDPPPVDRPRRAGARAVPGRRRSPSRDLAQPGDARGRVARAALVVGRARRPGSPACCPAPSRACRPPGRAPSRSASCQPLLAGGG